MLPGESDNMSVSSSRSNPAYNARHMSDSRTSLSSGSYYDYREHTGHGDDRSIASSDTSAQEGKWTENTFILVQGTGKTGRYMMYGVFHIDRYRMMRSEIVPFWLVQVLFTS